MEENYQRLIELISEGSGEPIEEIERKIEAKQAKLSGLISKEGAAQIIAAELGVNFDKQVVKINQIVPNMKKINLIGKVISLFPVREYNKNGRSGRIGSFILADETSNIRTVMWDENHIDLIVKGEIKQEFIVEISNASVRNGELHLTSFSEIKPSEKKVDNVVIEKPVLKKKIVDFNTNDNVSARAFIVQMFGPRFFEICPECRKKATEGKCVEHGPVNAEKRALINFVADDGSDSIRVVMFSDQIDKLINKEELENPELFSVKRAELLGKEMDIIGNIRKNSMFNTNEFIISDIKDIDLDELITELES
jgi:ssDNA-binding replication factor A large subunit